MDNKFEISVIVPVYNVSRYLKKCIDSILNQTYRDFELILVDDGSADDSGIICDEYEKEHECIKVIHKENGGLSDARNAGIEISGGRYITFIDPDDYVDAHFLDIIYGLSIKYNADVVIGGYMNIHENEEPDCEFISEGDKITRREAYRKMLMQEDIDVSACGKLYKRELFDNVRYPVGELYEDIQIIDKIIEQCDVIVYTKYKGYFYLQRTGSIMYGSMTQKRMKLIDASEELMLFIGRKYPDIYGAALRRYIYNNFHVLGRAVLDKRYRAEAIKIRKNILSHKKEILKSKDIRKKEKTATVFLIFGMPFYSCMWRIFCAVKGKKLT